jgi:hypothetical protein
MHKPPHRYLLLLILTAVLFGCDRGHAPTPLINDMRSGQSLEQVKALHELRNAKWETIEKGSHAPDGTDDTFDVLRVATRYRHLEFQGELILEFLNDKLMSTWFYPDDFDRYKASWDLSVAGQPTPLGESLERGQTRIWTLEDFDGRHYAGWEDEALAEERRALLEAYS